MYFSAKSPVLPEIACSFPLFFIVNLAFENSEFIPNETLFGEFGIALEPELDDEADDPEDKGRLFLTKSKLK